MSFCLTHIIQSKDFELFLREFNYIFKYTQVKYTFLSVNTHLDFEIPSAVSARITEWFNRNEMAESRNSETSNGTDSNLEDIREKAKNRLKQRKDELTEKTSCDTLVRT